MKRKGTIMRYFKEKKKKVFKIYKECPLGKRCPKPHIRPGKVLLQKKLDENNKIIYTFKNQCENKGNLQKHHYPYNFDKKNKFLFKIVSNVSDPKDIKIQGKNEIFNNFNVNPVTSTIKLI